jgi:hypothetical protein
VASICEYAFCVGASLPPPWKLNTTGRRFPGRAPLGTCTRYSRAATEVDRELLVARR